MYGQPEQQDTTVVHMPAADVFVTTGRTEPEPPPEKMVAHYPSTIGFIIGGAQIFCGIVLIGFNVGAFVTSASVSYSAVGVWSGLFFVVTGGFVLMAAHKPFLPEVKAAMGMTLAALIISVAAFTMTCYGIYMDVRTGNDSATVAMNSVMMSMSFIQGCLAGTMIGIVFNATGCTPRKDDDEDWGMEASTSRLAPSSSSKSGYPGGGHVMYPSS